MSSSICLAADPRIPSRPAAEWLAQIGRIHDRKHRVCRYVQFRFANRERSIHIVLLEQDRTHEAHDRIVVGEDADDLGASLNLAVEALDWICRVELGTMFLRRSCIPARRARPRP